MCAYTFFNKIFKNKKNINHYQHRKIIPLIPSLKLISLKIIFFLDVGN